MTATTRRRTRCYPLIRRCGAERGCEEADDGAGEQSNQELHGTTLAHIGLSAGYAQGDIAGMPGIGRVTAPRISASIDDLVDVDGLVGLVDADGLVARPGAGSDLDRIPEGVAAWTV